MDISSEEQLSREYHLASSPAPMVIVKVKSPDKGAFTNPSHRTPTDPPVDPTRETPAGTPDPQSRLIEESTWKSPKRFEVCCMRFTKGEGDVNSTVRVNGVSK